MSYFGVSGPAQDGGFMAGIGAGAQRLNNARAARANYSKTLAGRVSNLLGPTTDQPQRIELDRFIQLHSVLLTSAAITRLKIQLENDIIPKYYVDINDINGAQVEFLLNQEKNAIRSRVASENVGQSQANIELYTKTEAKRTIRENNYKPLFVDAGYDKDDAEALAQSAINRTAGATPITQRLKNAQYDLAYNPGPDEAKLEYVVNQGIPQNTTQYVVYGLGAAAIVYFLATRGRLMKGSARKSAFYGVFG